MFEKQSAGITYHDHDSHPGRDSNPGRVSQQRAGLATAGDVMSTWIVACYDYAEQVLKAQRRFSDSVLSIGAPMLDVARNLTSSDASEDRSDSQTDAKGNQRREGYQVAENAPYNDDDTAEYNKRSIDNDRSASDTTRTERANAQTDESAMTRTRGAASAASLTDSP